MNQALQFLIHYGAIVLFAGVLLQQIGVPAPGTSLMLAAGALCSAGRMQLLAAILAPIVACLIADACWYRVGVLHGAKQARYRRLEQSKLGVYMRNHGAHFARYGYMAFFISKFIPGPNMVSVFAARMKIARSRLLLLDAIASMLWAGGYLAVGYLFSRELQRIVDLSANFMGLILLVVIAMVTVVGAVKYMQQKKTCKPLRAALTLGCALLLATAAMAQSGGVQYLSATSAVQRSVPNGAASEGVLQLAFADAMKMALQYNLGGIESGENVRIARGQRLLALSKLLPEVNANLNENVNQANMATLGLKLPAISSVIGPYSYSSASIDVKQTLFSLESIQRLRAARTSEQAAQLNYQDTLDVIVLTVGNAYLQVLEASAHIEAEDAQVRNAQALYDHARNEYQAGTVPRIDATRTEVQLHSEQYNRSVARNDFAIAKLQLARAIGLPLEQQFELADRLPYAEFQPQTLEDALKLAHQSRKDLLEKEQQQKAAEQTLSATRAERYPVLHSSGGYGDVGTTFAHSHGYFNFNAGVSAPIFTGGKIKGEIAQAEANLRLCKAQVLDAGGQIDYEVRAAYLNLNAAREQVEVGHLNVELANENLSRSKDRFTSGVTDSVEVVQSEQTLASANNQYIASVYNHNLAKLAIARALGVARTGYSNYLGEK